MAIYETLEPELKHKIRHQVRRFRKGEDLPLGQLQPTDREVEVALMCLNLEGPVRISSDLTYRNHAECALFAGIPWHHYLRLLRGGCHPRSFIWPSSRFSPDSPVTHGPTPYPSLYSLSARLVVPPHLLYWTADRNLLSEPESMAALKQYGAALRALHAHELIRFPVLSRKYGDGLSHRGVKAETLCELCEALGADYVGVMAQIATGKHYAEAVDLVLPNPAT